MTPDIEKVLKACTEDVDWFIKVFEARAGESQDDRFKQPLERFQKLRARLELLRNTITVALLKASAKGEDGTVQLAIDDDVKSMRGDISDLMNRLGQIESGVAAAADKVDGVGDRMVQELFASFLRAAGGDAGAGGARPPAAPKSPKPPKPPTPPGKPEGAAGKADTKAAPKKTESKKKDKEPLPKAEGTKDPSEFAFNRYIIDLENRTVKFERVQCEDFEDALGGCGRAFKILEQRPVDDAYDPSALFIMNLGALSGSDFMTGLRTYFHGYSPLKVGESGKPGAMWTAGSGKFGTKLRFLDIDEVWLEGRSSVPILIRMAPEGEGGVVPEGREEGDEFGAIPIFQFLEAESFVGQLANDKIQELRRHFGKDAHFAVIGPAGENWQNVRYAAIALSTVNQLTSGDNKPRFCGRGGFGGVMGSKNLLGFIADGPDRLTERPKPTPKLKELNMAVARGKGSARFRDKRKNNGGGGTWANYEALNPIHAMPENNFIPTGTEVSFPLWRPAVEEKGEFMVKDEACFRCGIACHKNVYEIDGVKKNGKPNPGKFRAKLDFEPLNLLSSNIGIFDLDQACELVELVDLYCMDSISIGVTISYVMEYNKRHAGDDALLADGLSYGDYHGTAEVIKAIGTGRLPELGQGVKRLAAQTGEPEFAMHCKGIEFPAYLPQTNPGYPWALAGGHMSMRTYLLLLYERDTSMDYWVDAITNRGPQIMRDDVIGICKFAGLDNSQMCETLGELLDLKITPEQLEEVVMRTYLRGYRIERRQGFTADDYTMPAVAHEKHDPIDLPYFNTPEFFSELQGKVLEVFDGRLETVKLG